jgi:hypothetical protein
MNNDCIRMTLMTLSTTTMTTKMRIRMTTMMTTTKTTMATFDNLAIIFLISL